MSNQEANRYFENDVTKALERMEKIIDALSEVIETADYELTFRQIEIAKRIRTT